jgi:hypothetical protein
MWRRGIARPPAGRERPAGAELLIVRPQEGRDTPVGSCVVVMRARLDDLGARRPGNAEGRAGARCRP